MAELGQTGYRFFTELGGRGWTSSAWKAARSHHLLDDAGEPADRGFVVIARPQVEVTVRVILHLTAPGEQPGVNGILPSEQHHKEEETIVAAEEGFDVVVEKPLSLLKTQSI